MPEHDRPHPVETEVCLYTALRKVVRAGEVGDGYLLEALAHALEMPAEAVDLRVSRFDGTVGIVIEVPDESLGTTITEVQEKRRDRRGDPARDMEAPDA